uniref:flavin monoamine oxidase family protein n=1 Tax=Elioraea rosea TaxID=2492390 RepID=UPI00118603FB
ARPHRAPRIAVVGGGLAGLVAAYRLRQAGLPVTLHEARAAVGGRARSAEALGVAGLVQDLGGHFINGDHADMLGLAREFGIPVLDRRAAAAREEQEAVAFLFGGRRVPEAEMAAALSPFAARVAVDAMRLEAEEVVAAALDRLSVAAYLDRHVAVLSAPGRALVEASIRSEYGVEPEESSALQLLFNLPVIRDGRAEPLGNSDEAFVVREGAGRIPAALGAALGDVVRTGDALVAVARRGAVQALRLASGETVQADIVVLALPFPVLRGMRLDLDLAPALARFIAEGALGANEKVFAGFRDRPWREAGGFATAWSDAAFCNAWEATEGQPRGPDGVLTFLLGGDQAGRATPQAGPDLTRAIEAAGVPGLRDAATGRFAATAWRADPFACGAYASFRPGQLTDFAEQFWVEDEAGGAAQQVRAGGVFFVGEHLSDAFYGFMNGAAETGRLAAATILREVRG